MSPPQGIPGYKVLIVEDDPDLSSVLTLLLEREGAELLTAATAREALHLYQLHSPILVVLDLGLAEEDGFAVVERLREIPGSETGLLVIYTSRDLTESERHRLHWGTTHFFTKSRISPSDFRKTVFHLLDHSPLLSANSAATAP